MRKYLIAGFFIILLLLCITNTKSYAASNNYSGEMCIDTPTDGQAYNNAIETIEIAGWAVSSDSKAVLRLYINDNYVESIRTRIDREDVNTLRSYNYGGTKTTPQAGFTTTLDLRGYSNGTYNLSIYQVSRDEKIISCVSKTIKIDYAGEMCIDFPSENQSFNTIKTNTANIQGWAVSSDPDAVLRLYVNDTYIMSIKNRYKRSDVDYSISYKYGGTDITPNAGFQATLDLTPYEEGTYNIVIYQISKDETIISAHSKKISISKTTTWGVDVSHYNGNIDWETAKANGVNFAILKIGEYWASSDTIIKDSNFDNYYYACKSAGIAVGGYFYSYAENSRRSSKRS